MNQQAQHQRPMATARSLANDLSLKITSAKQVNNVADARARRRLCLILKVLSNTLDFHERQRLRAAINYYFSTAKVHNKTLPNNFINELQETVCAQVGLRSWSQCEALVDRFIALMERQLEKLGSLNSRPTTILRSTQEVANP
jgi:hypothetical protein